MLSPELLLACAFEFRLGTFALEAPAGQVLEVHQGKLRVVGAIGPNQFVGTLSDRLGTAHYGNPTREKGQGQKPKTFEARQIDRHLVSDSLLFRLMSVMPRRNITFCESR